MGSPLICNEPFLTRVKIVSAGAISGLTHRAAAVDGEQLAGNE
jgi:hypothetical protein